ncbi:autotransporter outer membrane beta-barrel domain-containing protein [Roseibium sp.]|uniref:autotransporter outer membrane beta-barrel domain-containing protein n=1 Tax=Roseibium sp. TaxID=1936156 RepID=UPI003A96C1A0
MGCCLGFLALGPVEEADAYVLRTAGAQNAITPRIITSEATGRISGDTIAFNWDYDASTPFAVGDRLEFSLSSGATFADSTYTLEGDEGGAGTGDLSGSTLLTTSPNGRSTIVFQLKATSGTYPLEDQEGVILSGASIAGQLTNVNLPQVPGVDIYLTATLRDASNNLKGSATVLLFDNTLQRISDQDYQAEIQSVLATHMTSLTSQSVGLAGLMTNQGFGDGGSNFSGLFGEYGQIANAFFATSGLSFPGSINISGGQGAFAASLNQLRAAKGMRMAEGDRTSDGEEPSPINVWIKGRWEAARDSRSSTTIEADFGVVYTGIDYRVTENTLVGVLAQADFYSNTSTLNNGKGYGVGWMFGPYFVTRLDDRLIWDGRVSWGLAKHHFKLNGPKWDEFDSARWHFETNLTGQFAYEGWDINPSLGLSYFAEQQESFTSVNGTVVGAQTVDYGSFKFGPEVSRDVFKSDGVNVRLHTGLRGIWDFRVPDSLQSGNGVLGSEHFRARFELGGSVKLDDFGDLYGRYAVDSTGSGDYMAHSVEVALNAPIRLGSSRRTASLSGAFNQSLGEDVASKVNLKLVVPLH